MGDLTFNIYTLQATNAKIERTNITGLTLEDLSSRKVQIC